MVEVFKTNVECEEHASMLLKKIHEEFEGYQANFDLEDCDNILRVETNSDYVQVSLLITLLNNFKFNAEVLPDVVTS